MNGGDITFANLDLQSGWFLDFQAGDSIVNDGPTFATSSAVKLPVGFAEGSVTEVNTFISTPRTRSAYLGWVFKLSANWWNHPSTVKIVQPSLESVGGGDTGRPYAINIRPSPVDNRASGQFTLNMETFGFGTASAFDENVVNTPLTVDTWYQLEVLSTIGNPTSTEGVTKWWVSSWNGSAWNAPVLRANLTSAIIDDPDASGDVSGNWYAFGMKMFYGGSGQPALTADQFVYTNRVRVSKGTV